MDSAQASQLLDQGVVVGSDGEEIGSVGQVFVDDTTNEPTWVTVKTGWFGAKESFVPLDAATVSGNRVTVPYDKDKIKGAPSHDVDQHLSPEEENDLYAYYGLGQGSAGVADTSTSNTSYAQSDTSYAQSDASYAQAGTTTAATTSSDSTTDVTRGAGHDTSGPNTDDAMTRSEEQLRVGTEKVEAGRARLRKYIVTEQETVTVPVSREEVRVEREPITDANRGQALSGGDLTEEEHEVVLTEERPVVQKEAVPVERVRLGTETVTENEQVSADVRKEEIEFVEGQDTTGTGTGTSSRS